MNKGISLALVVVGVVLVVYGLNASHSVGSDVSRAVSGTPTDKTIWLLIGGVLAGIIGIVGLVGGKRT
jgi:hypothetical protein